MHFTRGEGCTWLFCFVLLGRDLILYTDGANASTAVAANVVLTVIAGTKVQTVSTNTVACIKQTRPIAATEADTTETRGVAIARRRQENAIAITFARYLSAMNTI